MLQPLKIHFMDILRKLMRFIIDILFDFFLNNLHSGLILQNIVFQPQSPLIIRLHGLLEEVLLVVLIEISA